MGDRSTEKLVDALVEAGASDPLVAQARASRFHDFRSDSATPIVDLVFQLRLEGLIGLAERAMDGEFDATKEEADAWASSEEGPSVFRNLA